jgi:hypothetical protein
MRMLRTGETAFAEPWVEGEDDEDNEGVRPPDA